MLRPLVLAAALCLAACADVDDRSTDWNTLHTAILEPNCATIGCHSATTRSFNIDLSEARVAYRDLTGVECGDPVVERSGYVGDEQDLEGNVTGPTLVLLLRGESAAFPDTRMPLDRPLPEADIELVARWIAEGVPCE